MRGHAKTVPPDGGWGWAVVLASFFLTMIVDGLVFSSAIIYPKLLEDSTQENVSIVAFLLVGSTLVSLYMLIGPFAAVLINLYGVRRVSISGSLLSAAGFLISAVTRESGWLILSFGIFGGTGLGLLNVSAVVAVGHYFDKRRGLAIGFALFGSGVGMVIFPLLTEYLIEIYSTSDVLIIYAAICLQGCVCGMVMRPLRPTRRILARRKDLLDRITEMYQNIKKVDSSDSLKAELAEYEGNIKLKLMRQRHRRIQALASLDNSPSVSGSKEHLTPSGHVASSSPVFRSADSSKKQADSGVGDSVDKPVTADHCVQTDSNPSIEEMDFASRVVAQLQPIAQRESLLDFVQALPRHITQKLAGDEGPRCISCAKTSECLCGVDYRDLALDSSMRKNTNVMLLPTFVMCSSYRESCKCDPELNEILVLFKNPACTCSTFLEGGSLRQIPIADIYKETTSAPDVYNVWQGATVILPEGAVAALAEVSGEMTARPYDDVIAPPSDDVTALVGGGGGRLSRLLSSTGESGFEDDDMTTQRDDDNGPVSSQMVSSRDSTLATGTVSERDRSSPKEEEEHSDSPQQSGLKLQRWRTEETLNSNISRCSSNLEFEDLTRIGSMSSSCGFFTMPRIILHVLEQMLDISLLKDSRFWLISLGNLFVLMAFQSVYFFVANRGSHLAVIHDQNSSASLFVGVFGVSNAFSRLIVSFLSDLPRVNSLMVNNLALFVGSIACLVTPLSTDSFSFACLTAILGFTFGFFFSLATVILIDLFGRSRLSSAFGLVTLLRGLAPFSVLGMTLYYIKKTSDSGPPSAQKDEKTIHLEHLAAYDSIFLITGGMLALATAAHTLLLVPWLRDNVLKCREGRVECQRVKTLSESTTANDS